MDEDGDRGFCDRMASFFGREPFSGTLTIRTVLVNPDPWRQPVTTTTNDLALTICNNQMLTAATDETRLTPSSTLQILSIRRPLVQNDRMQPKICLNRQQQCLHSESQFILITQLES